MELRPKVGDLIRRKRCPHVGVIVEARGIDVTVRWVQPFWHADRRIEISTFIRTEAEVISRA